ncbi:MAG: chain length determinant protein EpsF [Betaproteobacteria bacterium]|nr:chain length determinant protein EpsF [Betaproteobacteria bacterium]MBI2293429.1 chain length determinant protein EpsF [Betaproteobacteria bacterium]MBI3053444.1 chain length determinant protein EpsF [Betaproteobacteria bacterium]
MNLQQFLLILRARYKLVLLVLLGTVTATLGVSLVLPKQYTATTSVVIDVKSPDPVIGMMLPGMAAPGYMATQTDIIQSDRVAQKVVKLLKLDANPTVRQQWMEATKGKGKLEVWLADVLQTKLDVKPARESNVISISYKAVDPGFAAAVANAFTQAYIETNVELKVEPARQYAKWFGEQGKSLRDNLEKAQAKLSAYQQEHGIVAIDERLDNETAKLNELSTQLTVVQGQTSDAQSKQRSGAASDTLPEVVQNPTIGALKVELARQEAKLQELAGNLGRNHPQYQRAESEIATLKRKLEVETRHITSGFSTSRAVGRDKEAELKAAIEAQKKKLLELKHHRDEVAVLMRDVDAAHKAYEAVSQRFNQTSLESQSTQTNVSVLTPAAEPTEPSFPKPLLNTLVSVFVGTLLGVGAALVLEMFDQRIRSVDDLGGMLQLPILGVIEKQQRRGPIRLAFWSRKSALMAR